MEHHFDPDLAEANEWIEDYLAKLEAEEGSDFMTRVDALEVVATAALKDAEDEDTALDKLHEELFGTGPLTERCPSLFDDIDDEDEAPDTVRDVA